MWKMWVLDQEAATPARGLDEEGTARGVIRSMSFPESTTRRNGHGTSNKTCLLLGLLKFDLSALSSLA